MERFGFVGLPNAGKSSLYNALSGGSALAAPYAFATKDPNVGVAKVLDSRLDRLAEMSASKNVIPASAAVSMIAKDVSSSLWYPNVIVPRHRRDTFRPVLPNWTCSIRISGARGGDRARARRGCCA